ncbi:MAG: GNAT family N-acetyltransferase [Clostridia bacterium]|nr:GNAT family N-acetyltransferase [Clostridia bacterium]
MRELIKITDKNEILKYLYEFSDVFPHLCEKIKSMEDFSEKLSKFSNFYIAAEDRIALGIAVFYSNNKIEKNAYITLFGLKESARKKGLSEWMLRQCEALSKKDDMKKISLEVDCDNTTAIAFYKKNGYAISGQSQRNSMYMYKIIGENHDD